MEQQEQGIPIAIEDIVRRLDVLVGENIKVKQDEATIIVKHPDSDWTNRFNPHELMKAMEDVYSEEQMQMIALGGEEGVAR